MTDDDRPGDDPAALAAAINDDPESAHGEMTPAVHALVEHGLDALPHVLPLLMDEDGPTRMRAQRVLAGVTRAWVEGRVDDRPLTRRQLRAWEVLWEENGSYDWRSPEPEREGAVEKWRGWLEGAEG